MLLGSKVTLPLFENVEILEAEVGVGLVRKDVNISRFVLCISGALNAICMENSIAGREGEFSSHLLPAAKNARAAGGSSLLPIFVPLVINFLILGSSLHVSNSAIGENFLQHALNGKQRTERDLMGKDV